MSSTDPVVPALGDVVDDVEGRRFVEVDDGLESELVYRLNGSRLFLIHAGVPDELSGRGIGGRLVRAALERARAEGLTIVPRCPFARAWIEKHPDEVGSVPIVD